MKQTPNLSLKKPDLTDVVNIEDLNQNFDTIDTEIKGAKDRADEAFQSASDGKIKIATAITGKGVTTSSSDTFQKMATNISAIETDKTGDATAVAGDILTAKIAYAKGIKLTGTMPNNGSIGTKNLTTEGAEYTIPAGYHNGLGKVKAVITGLIASVIKAGTTVGGIIGTFTSDATAIASDILSGKSGYVNGVKVSGTMPNYDKTGINNSYVESLHTKGDNWGSITMNPPTGYYVQGVNSVGHGSLIANDPNFIPANILGDKSIFGVQGGIPVYKDTLDALSVDATFGVAYMQPATGYHTGYGIMSRQPDLIPANILSGKSIFGMAGTAQLGVASGTSFTLSNNTTSVNVTLPGKSSIGYQTKTIIITLPFAPKGVSVTINGIYVTRIGNQTATPPVIYWHTWGTYISTTITGAGIGTVISGNVLYIPTFMSINNSQVYEIADSATPITSVSWDAYQ